MVADSNTPKPMNITEKYVDGVTPSTQIITIVADEATQIVADNITTIQALAKSLSTLLTATSNFNTNYDKLTNERVYDNNSKTGLEVLDSSLELKNYLSQINGVATNLQSIITTSNLEEAINQITTLEEEIRQVVNNLEHIKTNSTLKDYIVDVAAISEDIVKVRQMSKVLHIIKFNMEKLITIYNYLPQLLRIVTIIGKYLDLQQEKQFTDSQVYDAVKLLVDNLEAILKVSGQVDTMVDIADRLDEIPDLLENIDKQLKDIFDKYQQQLENEAKGLIEEFDKTIIDTRIKFQELIERQSNYVEECRKLATDLNQIKSDIKLEQINLEHLKYKLESESKSTIQEIQNKFLNMEMQYKNNLERFFTENSNKLSKQSDEFFIKLTQLENTQKQQFKLLQEQFLNALQRIDNYSKDYENFKSQVEIMIKARLGEMIKVDLTPFLNSNRYSREDIIKLFTEYAEQNTTIPEEKLTEIVNNIFTNTDSESNKQLTEIINNILTNSESSTEKITEIINNVITNSESNEKLTEIVKEIVNNTTIDKEEIQKVVEQVVNNSTLTEDEIKTLIKDSIAAQNLTREEVIDWLQRLNAYRDEKLYIEDFDTLLKG